MLRFWFVFSATTFSSYNPDIAKNRVMPQIGLASPGPTWKAVALLGGVELRACVCLLLPAAACCCLLLPAPAWPRLGWES